jgi:hypothetical protein
MMEYAREAMTKDQLELYKKFKDGKIILHYDLNMCESTEPSPNFGCYFKRKPYMVYSSGEELSPYVPEDTLDSLFLMIIANREGKSAEKYGFVEVDFEENYELVKIFCKNKEYFVDLLSVKFYYKNKKYYKVFETETSMYSECIQFELFLKYLMAHIVIRGKIEEFNFYQKANINGKYITIHNINFNNK